MTFQEYLKNRKNGSGSAADSVSSPENKFQAYVARRKAGNWASSADSFIQKIQSDYSARQQGSYQSPESIQEYKDITELDASTLNRLIKEIVVHETIDSDKTRHISIEIHFNLKPIPEVEQVTA